MSRLRKVIAKRMVESLQISAQLTTVVEVDVTKVARLRDRAKGDFEKREGTKLSFLPFFALAAVEALKAYPTVNASIDGDEVDLPRLREPRHRRRHREGLTRPRSCKNAGDLNIAGLARAIADVAERTRNNKITPDDLGPAAPSRSPTPAVAWGALRHPDHQPAAGRHPRHRLGREAPWSSSRTIRTAARRSQIRSMMYLALSYDHRIVDGADAARFLVAR
jgi:pyruvate dehydrogenase E2 component (dihydrolipoamide acetyltransferase)